MSGALSRAREWLRALTHRQFDYESCSDEDYVRMAYAVLLKRGIDPTGLAGWRQRIASGQFSRQSVVSALLASEEYASSSDGDIDIIGILHRARQRWIRTVPAFDSVLDIGGSSVNRPEGALIELGYPHRPATIDILDLPPEQQYWGTPKYSQAQPIAFPWGVVTYVHGRAEQIQEVLELQGRRYDAVFLGQAIEHIYPESLPGMLRWVRNHLRPAGKLVFDTPNRLLTKIQCPGSLTDPDHKHEYAPSEMERVIQGAGFEVTRKTGLVHLPVQASTGVYDQREFAHAAMLSDDVDSCYLFAFECRIDAGQDSEQTN